MTVPEGPSDWETDVRKSPRMSDSESDDDKPLGYSQRPAAASPAAAAGGANDDDEPEWLKEIMAS